jgi:ligand-binding SRPBCC domain-containing protein
MYQLKRTQFIPADIDVCWEFFSNPNNLQKITPEYMRFQVLTEVPDTMYPGLMIAYKVRPVLGIPLNWLTEITHVEHHRFFVDEQRIGPYKIWHHEHHFVPVDGGVEMTDIVTYHLPFGILGKLAHALFVRKQLEGIFTHRFKAVEELF